MRVDYHVHTCFSSGCETPPSAVVAAAMRRGLDAIAITDHDTTRGWEAISSWVSRKGLGLEIIPGIEVTTVEGVHLLGIDVARPFPAAPAAEVIEAIRAEGGLSVLAHPFRRGTGLLGPDAGPGGLGPEAVDAILRKVDALEVANARDGLAEIEQSLSLLPRYPGLGWVAGSDAHAAAWIGAAYACIEDRGRGWNRGSLVCHRLPEGSGVASLAPGAALARGLRLVDGAVGRCLEQLGAKPLVRAYRRARGACRERWLWRRAGRLWRAGEVLAITPGETRSACCPS